MNIQEEYIYTEHGWEMIGSTQLDLTGYYASDEEVWNILMGAEENNPTTVGGAN